MTKQAAPQLEQHPLALKLVPGTMPDEEFEAFCADLKKRGQRVKIVRFEGKILDGMHRYRGCLRNGMTPDFEDFTGDDPEGLVIALNVLRRKLGSIQRALAGARLNIDYGITQEEASKRVGVSKVHINLVAQALNSNNARIIKLLEKPDLTREQLHEQLVEVGIVKMPNAMQSSAAAASSTKATLSGAGATAGLDAFFAGQPLGSDADDAPADTDGVELDDLLGAPPSAGGKVLAFNKPAGGGSDDSPVAGTRPKHPERVSRDTPASLLADRFRGLPESDQISFMQLTWHLQRKLLKPAGLSPDADTPPSTKATSTTPSAPRSTSKATSAQAKAAEALASATIASAAKGSKAAAKPAKPARGSRGTANA